PVLRVGVVVHGIAAAVDRARDGLGPRRTHDEPARANARAELAEVEARPAAVARVALVEPGRELERTRVRDLDPDGAVVDDARVSRALDEVERLVERPVDIEKEMAGEPADVVEDLEAVPRRPRDVVVDDDEIEDLAERLDRPPRLRDDGRDVALEAAS